MRREGYFPRIFGFRSLNSGFFFGKGKVNPEHEFTGVRPLRGATLVHTSP